ncbi:MAG: DUF484 family protein [Rhodospirillales bacterium]|nr:DUF484 family protein [Alphaproteobacteria bacterium]MCB9987559.1 DUF484 family protein [Rhodospirillales bacterium]USO07720.1 MAG: DUF484 family protein [Rhodospirillales bacterium]
MMTETKTPADSLKEKDILAWLKANPHFLQRHPDVLEHMHPPKEDMGKGVADFQHYMVERLKRDRDAITETTRDLIEVSRVNMNSVTRIQQATLKLLEARNFIQFIQAITMDLATILDVDVAVLVVESNGNDIPNIHASGIRVVPAGTIAQWMQGKTALLQGDIEGTEAIYGGAARLVRSQSVLRVDISMQTPPAVLCFGSRDPEMFRDGQGTELVSFLARVVERMFRLWLDIPA